MKDIQEIVKKVANRYNVEYDPSSSGPKVKHKDGSIKSLDISDFENLFYKPEDNNNWHQINSVQGTHIRKSRMQFGKATNQYSAEELAVMSY